MKTSYNHRKGVNLCQGKKDMVHSYRNKTHRPRHYTDHIISQHLMF